MNRNESLADPTEDFRARIYRERLETYEQAAALETFPPSWTPSRIASS
jgi:hypothetical protein